MATCNYCLLESAKTQHNKQHPNGAKNFLQLIPLDIPSSQGDWIEVQLIRQDKYGMLLGSAEDLGMSFKAYPTTCVC